MFVLSLSSFSPKCATFCMVGLLVEPLLCHILSPRTLHLTACVGWGSPAALPSVSLVRALGPLYEALFAGRARTWFVRLRRK